MSIVNFTQEIKTETDNYKRNLGKKGGISPIFLEGDINIQVNESDVKYLCNAFLQNKLDKWELNYIIEGILLSDNIDLSSEKVENALLALSDSEYFKLVNYEFVKDILEELQRNSVD